ncbi:DUF3050 domain-containing protein [Lysobacter olei]
MDVDVVLTPQIQELRTRLERHRVFDEITDMASLRAFMQVHVFAVWDFMSLTKRLQRDLTCVTLPWMPPADPCAARLVNDIVLAEESDVDAQGQPASHLDLYLVAMRDVGASTTMFEQFLSGLRAGLAPADAFEAAGVPRFVRRFVSLTLDTCQHGTTVQAMASFFYGRENVIPGMFQGLLDRWGLSAEQAPGFVYYLQRHIELDGDNHGPAASRMISAALGRFPDALEEARHAACDALSARHDLWEGTAKLLRASRSTPFMDEVATALA